MEIYGLYGRTLFRNETSGLTTFSFITTACREQRNSRGELICRGVIPVYSRGTPILLQGEPKNTKFGWEFSVAGTRPYSNKEELTINYLSSGDFEGIGKKIAQKIVEITGPDVFSFIQNPESLKKLSESINQTQLDSLVHTLRNTYKAKEVMDYIAPFGGNYLEASRIVQLRPSNSIEALKKDCYKVGLDAQISFYVCDSIAKAQGYFAFDERRVRALLITSLSQICASGHTCSTIQNIYKAVARIAKSSAFPSPIPQGLLVRSLHKEADFIIESDGGENVYYLAELYNTEVNLAKEARRIQEHRRILPYLEDINELVEDEEGIEYSPEQKEAFSFLRTTGIKILTGGPGTGKSTVIKGIIRAYKSLNPGKKILLCAPTGRAAQKLREITGEQAQTIHRALDIKPFGNEIQHKTLRDPLDYNFFIVDEMSMADTTIISMLLGAIPTNSLVLLCGDINQLPSVGPGAVLGDMIASKRFETVALQTIYRQDEGSSIVSNAIKINEGQTDIITDRSFKVITVPSEQDIQDTIIDLMIEKNDPCDIYKTQVLSSTKKGMAGTKELNITLQPVCNPHKVSENPIIEYGSFRYSIGDKVMMISNNYTLNYFNGDIGVIRQISDGSITIDLHDDTIVIGKENLCDMVPALAVTVHKSQGGEYNTVILALPSSPSIMLQRNLLYTAVTRAKKEIIIVTQEGAIEQAIQTVSNSKRETKLLKRLRK